MQVYDSKNLNDINAFLVSQDKDSLKILLKKRYKEVVWPLAESIISKNLKEISKINNKKRRDFFITCLRNKVHHYTGASTYFTLLDKKRLENNLNISILFQIIADILDSDSEESNTPYDIKEKMHKCLLVLSDDKDIDPLKGIRQKKTNIDLKTLRLLLQSLNNSKKKLSLFTAKNFLKKSLQKYIDNQLITVKPKNAWDLLIKRDFSNRPIWLKKKFKWFEYYASGASTLPIFGLLLFSNYDATKNEMEKVYKLHYSWLNAFHIMLNHWDGLKEDERRGTINFIKQYGNDKEIRKNIELMYSNAKNDIVNVQLSPFFKFVLDEIRIRYLNRIKNEERVKA